MSYRQPLKTPRPPRPLSLAERRVCAAILLITVSVYTDAIKSALTDRDFATPVELVSWLVLVPCYFLWRGAR